MNVSDSLDIATSIFADERVDVTEADLLRYFNEAVRAVCGLKPDANLVDRTWVLTTGTRQTVPADVVRIHTLDCNMGGGSTPGATILRGDYAIMDRLVPNWRADATATTGVSEWFYDDETPLQFDVYPGVASGSTLYVRGRVYAVPAEVTALGDTFPFRETYLPAVNEWVLYRGFCRDAEGTPNYSKGTNHLTNFYNQLQIKQQAKLAVQTARAGVE